MALPIPRVRVGVTKIRRKFDFESAHIIPHAHKALEADDFHAEAITTPASAHAAATFALLQDFVSSNEYGEIGHIIGNVTQNGACHTSIRVKAENIGSHSFTLNPSPTGFPNTTGSFPGASGAQFIGKLIHPPPPNPHERPFARFSEMARISRDA